MVSENGRINLGDQDQVSAILTGPHRTSDTGRTGLIIAHGAGNDMHNPLIVSVAEGLARAGSVTLRFNFPYKEKGKKSPDAQAKLVHTWQCAYDSEVIEGGNHAFRLPKSANRTEADVYSQVLKKCVSWLGGLE